MSMVKEIEVKCPKCGKKAKFKVWETLNTVLNYELKKSVRDGSLFQFKCAGCGEMTKVMYDFLYHQMESRTIIYLALSDEYARDIQSMLKTGRAWSMFGDDYIFRMVRTENELREKLMIMDAGMDDRVVELIKLAFLYAVEKQEKRTFDEMYFCLYENGEMSFELYADEVFQGTIELTKESYADMEEELRPRLPESSQKEWIINRTWAEAHIDCFSD